MRIFIGADHRGFELKEQVKKWLQEMSIDYEDEGALELNLKDDYTTIAVKVAEQVAANESSKGILACGSGVGVDVVANKFDGIRASVGKTPAQVKAGRKDDDMNVLVLAADYTSDDEAKDMLREFLETEFSGEDRHKRRLQDIEKIEENN